MEASLEELTERLLENDASLTYLKLDHTLNIKKKISNTNNCNYDNFDDSDCNIEKFLFALEKNQTVEAVFILSSFLRQLINGSPYIIEHNVKQTEKLNIVDRIFYSILRLPNLKNVSISLRKFNRNEEHTKNIAISKFANALATNATLTELELHASGMDWELFSGVVLQNNKTLKKLDVRNNGIDPRGIHAICNILKPNEQDSNYNSTLTHLGLGWNRIGHEGCIDISSMLERNSTLTYLDLSCTGIVDEDCYPIAKALFNNNYNNTYPKSSLKHLILSDNDIGCKGCKILVDHGLCNNTTLTNLDLTWNHVEFDGYNALANLVCNHTNMTLESIGDYQIPNPKLQLYLRLNQAGRHRLLRKNTFTKEDWVQTLYNVRNDMDCIFSFLSFRPDLCVGNF